MFGKLDMRYLSKLLFYIFFPHGLGFVFLALMPCVSRDSLTSSIRTSPRWKIPAANAASTPVFSNTSTKCCTFPAPLLATTGMLTFCRTRLTRSRSNPRPVPSRSMLFNRISPAPSTSAPRASSTTDKSRASRPPETVHWYHRPCPPHRQSRE